MTAILVSGPVMAQERMNICQNAMSAPRLTPATYKKIPKHHHNIYTPVY